VTKKTTRMDKGVWFDPFFQPVPPPDSEPDDTPLTCISFNEDYLPYLLGASQRLLYPDAFKGTPSERELAAKRMSQLFAMLQMQDCPEGLPSAGCELFLPSAPFITYAPNDPFSTPEYIPPGYIVPPWYTNPAIPLPGVRPTDAMVNFLSFPVPNSLPDILQSGLPRATIRVEGTGELEIEFIKIPFGGIAMIVVDGNPLTVRVDDLNTITISGIQAVLDLFGIIYNLSVVETSIIEIMFETPGIHTIDITFLPRVDASTILGACGGLRRVSFCADTLEGVIDDMAVTGIRQNLELCRWEVEYNNDDVWHDIGDIAPVECINIPDIAITDVLRVNQCALEGSDDGGQTWEVIPNADWLRRDGHCKMIGKFTLEPIDTSPGYAARIAIPPAGQVGSYEVFQAQRQNGSYYVLLDGLGNWYHFGSTGYVQITPTGNQIVFSRNGGNFIDFGGATAVGMFRVGFVTSLSVMSGGRVSAGGFFNRNVQMDVQSQNVNYIGLAVKAAVGQVADLAIFEVAGYGTASKIKPTGAMDALAADNLTSQTTAALTITHDTLNAAAPSVDFGVSLDMTARTSTGAKRHQARLESRWSDVTDASRKAIVELQAYDTAPRTAIRAYANGANAEIGFLGSSTLPRQTISGDCYGNAPLKAMITALAGFGLVNDQTTLGAIPLPPEANTCDMRCSVAHGAALQFRSHLLAFAAVIHQLKDSELSLGEIIQSSTAIEAWGYFISLWWPDLVEYIYEYGVMQDILDEITGLAGEMPERLWCYLDDCGKMPPLNLTDLIADLEAYAIPADGNPRILYARYFAAFIKMDFDTILAHGLTTYVEGANCDDFDCEFPPTPEFDYCRLADFRDAEYWQLTDRFQPGESGVYVSGQGWKTENREAPGAYTAFVAIEDIIGGQAEVNRIIIEVGVISVGEQDEFDNLIELWPGSGNPLASWVVPAAIGEYTYTYEPTTPPTVTELALRFTWRNDDTVQYIRSIQIEGTGTAPAGLAGVDCY